ncbi:MAG: PAS domain S-box protein, partial [Proteobacteria bacterium]|nr:PAS domain S-box protein [Pseudomonadota bacterium]
MSPERRILIVEDEALIAEELRERLLAAGYAVTGVAESGAEAIAAVAAAPPDLVLMDVRLKGPMDGIEAAGEIYGRHQVPVVYLTAHSDQATLQRARARATFGYVLKPFQLGPLLVAIDVGLERARVERELREHHLGYETILGGLTEAVIAADATGRVRFLNAAAERLLGRAARECTGEALERLVAIRDAAGVPLPIGTAAALLRRPLRFEREHVLVREDGGRVAVDGSAAAVRDYGGRAVGIALTLSDATGMRRAAAELTALTHELRVVIDTAVDGVLMIDAQGVVRRCNPAAGTLFGLPPEELVGRRAQTLIPWPPPPRAPWRWRGTGAAPVTGFAPVPATAHHRDGAAIPVELSVGEVEHLGDRVAVVVVHDVSERRALETAYSDAARDERARIAQDLHDSLGQELTGIALLLSALERAALERGLANGSDIGHVRDLATHTIATCRALARGLLPVEHAPGGLAGGLRELVRRLGELHGPPIHFALIERATLGLSASVTDHLYRIAQEALTNALKHAQAQAINVTLEVAPQAVVLRVCDDGRGLAAPAAEGLGFKTMRYRADLIGAQLLIQPNDD